ncbi:ATP-binding protein [Phycisphaeraceae bacterium D3-23]
MLVLNVIQGPDKGMRLTLPDDEPQMIGRSSESIVLSDQTISRRHAELTPEGDGTWYIRDLQSANGTFINGVRATPERRKLRLGDQIRTGNTLLIYGENVRNPLANRLKLAPADEIDVAFERTIDANDESMIMSSPEPSQAAQFQLQIVYELVALIGSVTDTQELLDKVMDVVFEYFSADRGFVLLCEHPLDEPDPVVLRFREDEDTLPDPNRPATISRTIVHYVLERGVAVLSSNAMSDTRFTSGDSVQAYGIRSAMCVPIKHKEHYYGVIHLDSQIANYTFTEDQLSLLTAIGVQTGLALDNARLLEGRVQEERLAAMGQTIASLSHSIKNILQGMRGGSDLVDLGMRKKNPDAVKQGWRIVQRNQEKIFALTLNMLQYSKQRQPELEMAHLTPMFEDLVELVQARFDAKQVALIVDIEPGLPPVPVEVSGMHQAVLNLLHNALDACESERGAVTLACRYDGEENEVKLSVADNGVGMNRAQRQHLFKPFVSTKGYGGTGLGLVVTKKIVEEHGGWVEVQSKVKKGTTITIHLPTEMQGESEDTISSHGTQVPTPWRL